MRYNKGTKTLFVLLISTLCPSVCFADFGLNMYQGDSFRAGAGAVSTSDNAAVAYNNPAGLGLVAYPKTVLFEGLYYDTSVKYTDLGSTDAVGSPLKGNDGGDGGKSQIAPAFYFSDKINSKWSYGFALNSPFGLSVNWDNTWVGRYHVIKTGIKTLNINPGLSYKLTNNVYIGIGVSAQYATAELSNAIDFGAICYSKISVSTCTTLGMTPQSADGYVNIKGDDWGYGYNLGLMIHESNLNFGMSYRSKIDYKLKGNADFTTPSQASVFSPAFTDTRVTVPITLPEIIALGVSYQVTNNINISTNATWTRWSRIKSFNFQFSNASQPDVTIKKNWNDTWRYALGVKYRESQKWAFEGGIAYAKSAIPDNTLDPSVPTTDAWWFSFGAIYRLSEKIDISAGVNHIRFTNRTMNNTSTYGDTQYGVLRPKLNVFAARLQWRI